MRKAVLIRIQPKWCELIASGKKTVEVRKTKPKLDTPFKVYIYQTKRTWIYNIYSRIADWQKKVIGEFVCDKVIPVSVYYNNPNCTTAQKEFPFVCMTDKQIIDYLGNGKQGYGWHISDLKIYDKPKELSEFYKPAICDYNEFEQITRAPQSWCHVERLVGEE